MQVAVLLPCYNEEAAIAETIAGFRQSLPDARIYVFDNASTDRTVEIARSAGATVRSVTQQGKGNVVRRMFADVDADVYVMADGDLTYDPTAAPEMVRKLWDEQLDMVVGTRHHDAKDAYRGGHVLGNRLFTNLLSWLFGRSFSDIFSGYRAFSRRYAKSFPALSEGFETETEMSVHALELRMPVGEVATRYGARPEGSESKLSTFRDGWRILRTIGTLFRVEQPRAFYGTAAATIQLAAILIAIPLFITYFQIGLVPRFPTAVLVTGMTIVAVLTFFAGLIISAITRQRREVRRIAYLAQPAPGSPADR
ncbi:glycosyltransferase [Sphingomicrobium lutaoense]|uniref:Glycosyltransferase involved in cell wall biosynthesis n=1 Tax=Sphingomicrobium lutaoense TaxID=515949 RepID=A0A839Z1U9_9SPHN|nr:glycosyltransferase [Sphingomicrobium lutaoense]MBB3763565.1 glycosyltransferase involved in cell wall biosynthesis [Sphingomicrobium lutaoense]